MQFEVGQKRNDAIVRLYNAVYSNRDWQPPGLGVGEALVSPKGIDDVPILTLTLWSRAPTRSAMDLAHVARTLQAELQRVPGTRDVHTIGAPADQVRVDLDPARLAGYGLTVLELGKTLENANVVKHLNGLVGDGRETPVQAGTLVANRDDVADLVVAAYDGAAGVSAGRRERTRLRRRRRQVRVVRRARPPRRSRRRGHPRDHEEARRERERDRRRSAAAREYAAAAASCRPTSRSP